MHTEMSAMEAARKAALKELVRLSSLTNRLDLNFVEQVLLCPGLLGGLPLSSVPGATVQRQ